MRTKAFFDGTTAQKNFFNEINDLRVGKPLKRAAAFRLQSGTQAQTGGCLESEMCRCAGMWRSVSSEISTSGTRGWGPTGDPAATKTLAIRGE